MTDTPNAADAFSSASPDAGPSLRISVIVPARNEADCLAACLDSLIAQSERGFALGTDWELIIVDDDSADSTREIAGTAAASREGVIVLQAPPLDLGPHRAFTGKTNACWAAAQQARGAWLLFTDADTIHDPGNLSRAMHEAEKYHASLLSYSPRQLLAGFWQHAIMPLVFSELASVYPPKQVSDRGSLVAAANGQFLMVDREAYFAVGGHRAVGREILEDVALARNIKHAGYGIRFRYGPDTVSARMYRSLPQMIEGWTKNLPLLLPRPLSRAAMQVVQFLLFFGLPALALWLPSLFPLQRVAILLVWLRTTWAFYHRVARSNFPAPDVTISILGVPFFVWLLLRSSWRHRVGKSVAWKGRNYKTAR